MEFVLLNTAKSGASLPTVGLTRLKDIDDDKTTTLINEKINDKSFIITILVIHSPYRESKVSWKCLADQPEADIQNTGVISVIKTD